MGTVVTVTLVDLPLDVYRQASEHHDELARELVLIQQGCPPDGVPFRLQRLVNDLGVRYAAFTAAPTAAIQAALGRGDQHVDVVYEVPADAKAAVEELDSLLDEADDFCRAGGHLLTLAAPPHVVAFRKWFLGEFKAQIDGAPPTPWHRGRELAGKGEPADDGDRGGW